MLACEQGHLLWVSREYLGGAKASRREKARGLLIFEFRPLRGVKSAFDMYQITI